MWNNFSDMIRCQKPKSVDIRHSTSSTLTSFMKTSLSLKCTTLSTTQSAFTDHSTFSDAVAVWQHFIFSSTNCKIGNFEDCGPSLHLVEIREMCSIFVTAHHRVRESNEPRCSVGRDSQSANWNTRTRQHTNGQALFKRSHFDYYFSLIIETLWDTNSPQEVFLIWRSLYGCCCCCCCCWHLLTCKLPVVVIG